MKKIAILLMLVGACTIASAQTDVSRGQVYTVVDAVAPASISGTDTTIYVDFPTSYSPKWSTLISWASVTGTGTVALYVSYDGTTWVAYNTSPSSSVTGSSSYAFEDDRMVWRYLGFKITKGSISAGTITAKLLLK